VRRLFVDRDVRWLTVIVALGALARVAVAVYLGNVVEPISPAYDQIYFHDVAVNLLAGRGFVFTRTPWPFIRAGEPTAYVSFLYNLLLAGVYGLFGVQPLVARVIQALLCSLMPLQVYWLVRLVLDRSRRWGERAGAVAVVAAAITAGYAYFVYYSATLQTEGLYLMAVVWSLSATLKLADAPTLRHWAVWGLAVTLASLLRQAFMPMAALLFLYVLVKGFRRVRVGHVAAAAGIAAVLILPWTARNYVVFDRFLLLNSQAGQVFWNANHPDLGTTFEGSPMFDIPADLRDLNEVNLSNELMRRGLRNVAADPGRFVRLSMCKLVEFYRFWPAPDSSTLNNVARTGSFAVCLPLMVVGLALSLREWRRWLLLYLFIGAYTSVHAVTWPGIRYRMPVDAALVPFAALTVVAVASRAAARRAKHRTDGSA
jgi:hypothetical protein